MNAKTSYADYNRIKIYFKFYFSLADVIEPNLKNRDKIHKMDKIKLNITGELKLFLKYSFLQSSYFLEKF